MTVNDTAKGHNSTEIFADYPLYSEPGKRLDTHFRGVYQTPSGVYYVFSLKGLTEDSNKAHVFVAFQSEETMDHEDHMTFIKDIRQYAGSMRSQNGEVPEEIENIFPGRVNLIRYSIQNGRIKFFSGASVLERIQLSDLPYDFAVVLMSEVRSFLSDWKRSAIENMRERIPEIRAKLPWGMYHDVARKLANDTSKGLFPREEMINLAEQAMLSDTEIIGSIH